MLKSMYDHGLVKDFLSTNYSGCSYSFLHGSRAKGAARPDSDVDLIVIFEASNVSRRRDIVEYRGCTYDVSVMSHAELEAYLDNSHVTKNYRAAFMLEDALPIPRENDVARALVDKARRLLDDKQRPKTPDSFMTYFASLLVDIRAASGQAEQIYLMNEAYRCVAEFVLRWHGRRDGRKHAFNTFQRVEPLLLKKMNETFVSSLQLGEVAQFVLFAEDFLMKVRRHNEKF